MTALMELPFTAIPDPATLPHPPGGHTIYGVTVYEIAGDSEDGDSEDGDPGWFIAFGRPDYRRFLAACNWLARNVPGTDGPWDEPAATYLDYLSAVRTVYARYDPGHPDHPDGWSVWADSDEPDRTVPITQLSLHCPT